MLNETMYGDGPRPPALRRGKVKYLVRGKECIFTGMTSPRQYNTTINAAEFVVQAITEREGFDPLQITFFDLQTHHGYDFKQKNEIHFSKLILERKEGKLAVVRWEELPCPPSVRLAFGLPRA